METLIVTRHKGLVDWLAAHGIKGEVKERTTAEEILGKHVYGVLPYKLAAAAELYTEVSMDVPTNKRGRDMSAEELEEFNPEMHTWRVVEVHDARLVNGCKKEN